MISIQNIRYVLLFIPPEGSAIDLTDSVVSLSWQESMEELAMKAQATIVNSKTKFGYLHKIICPGGKICIYSDYGSGIKEVFRGTIWHWDYRSSKEKLLKITAYDDLIYLQKSKDNRYFAAGQSTKSIVQSIAEAWQIPLDYQWKSITHSKILYKDCTIAQMIFSVLNEAKAVLGEPFVFLTREGTSYILPWGSNGEVFTLSSQDLVISTQNNITLDHLTTKVIISGKADDEGRTPLLATVEGQTQYGVLQEIIPYTKGSSLSDLKKKGESLLKSRGKPEENISLVAPDIPSLRKGDLIHIAAGNLIGDFWAVGISHQCHTKQITVQLQRKGEEG